MNNKYNSNFKTFNEHSVQQMQCNIQLAYNDWLLHKSHIKQTARKYHTDPTKLTKYILSQGHRLTTFNENVFNNIDTEEKAYWLGFLYADGAMNKKQSSLELSLQVTDSSHIEKFIKFLECDRTVKKDSFRCRFSASSKILYNDLNRLGCTFKKSFTIQFPQLPYVLIRHFIRGYFDGDGSITRARKTDSSYTSISLCSGSSVFIKSIISEFNKHTNSHCKQQGYKPNNAEVYVICLQNTLCKKFLNWLYEDSVIYLERKYDRYNNSIAVQLRN
jgi:hypothetical protein